MPLSFKYSVIFVADSSFTHELLIKVCLSALQSEEEEVSSAKLSIILNF